MKVPMGVLNPLAGLSRQDEQAFVAVVHPTITIPC